MVLTMGRARRGWNTLVGCYGWPQPAISVGQAQAARSDNLAAPSVTNQTHDENKIPRTSESYRGSLLWRLRLSRYNTVRFLSINIIPKKIWAKLASRNIVQTGLTPRTDTHLHPPTYLFLHLPSNLSMLNSW